MLEDEYIKLEKLKKKNEIGVVLTIIIFILGFFWPVFIALIAPDTWNNIKDHSYLYPIVMISSIFLALVVANYFCGEHDRVQGIIMNKVNKTILKEEMNNTFNNTYKRKKSRDFIKILKEHKIGTNEYISTENCFSATYNNIPFQYAYAFLEHGYGEDSYYSFRGPIYVFDTKYMINGDLYLGKKIKKLFKVKSDMDLFINTKKNIDIEPSNIVLDKNISIKSNAHPSIIEDSAFLEIIKEFIISKKCIFIYHENKLFVLKKNEKYLYSQPPTINRKEDELKVKEHIVKKINSIKSDLDSIIKYKDKLNIREDRHMKTINEEEIINENN